MGLALTLPCLQVGGNLIDIHLLQVKSDVAIGPQK